MEEKMETTILDAAEIAFLGLGFRVQDCGFKGFGFWA